MDADRFDGFVRALFTSPSRRAVNRSFAGIVASALLAPLFAIAHTEAKKKKKKGNKNKKWKALCKANKYLWGCPAAPKNCCYQDIEFGIRAVCTECGCCYEGASKCCLPGATSVNHLGLPASTAPCCADDQTCCFGENGEVSCCDPDSLCCGGSCCAPAFSSQCCGGENCCHYLETCCPDGVCRLAC